MRLRSLTLKGFKSFPDRTTLEFGPGVSVVVGPNGSGKSNVTDAVLWAMGEQSPLAVRGQSMQDVIFGGGHGVQPRSAAEVEIVLDNADGTVPVPFSEISIARRLDRNGDGGYRLNGARCRLTDVIEVLSDTGLGKETHSVISQGRVDAIVTSRARDRRLLIEEAAGLGKHRKRRRRAQLKLDRTQENLDRALDVEREARTRLRPLKRQAEAAELHERLERQILQARLELAEDAALTIRGELDRAEAAAAAAREARAGVEARLAETVERRGAAERALSERAERHDALAGRAFRARAAGERLALRGEQAAAAERTLDGRIERIELEFARAERAVAGADEPDTGDGGRLEALAAELAEIDAGREQELERELVGLAAEADRHQQRVAECEAELARAHAAREAADAEAAAARESAAAAEREAQRAREASARVGAELAAANQFLRVHAAGVGDGAETARSLSGELRVRDGFELALAAALGGRLDAALVGDLRGAHIVLDRAGPDGGSALLTGTSATAAADPDDRPDLPPAPGAVRLLDLVTGPESALAAAARLLADAWVVEDLDAVSDGFSGIAVTRSGRVWFAAWGEVRQLVGGGGERVLAARNERERLVGEAEQAAQAVLETERACAEAGRAVDAAEATRVLAEDAHRDGERRRSEAAEELRRSRWLIEQRRGAPAEGALAVRRAEIEGELAAERRQAERSEAERAARAARVQRLRAQLAADEALVPAARRLARAVAEAAQAVGERADALERELQGDREAGEQMATELRRHAAEESRIQADLRTAGEAVTEAEVAAQRARDRAAEAELERGGLAERLGIEPAAGEGAQAEGPAPLSEEELETVRERARRLERRREQLGPVNPLAQDEYAQAVEHVEELESRRDDLETSLRELRGVIREADRQIEETFAATFAAAARNFEELVGDVFPGGSGRLVLVAEEQTPRPVLGGQAVAGDGGQAAEDAADAEAEAELRGAEERELPGVEIEITPAGKATKRLSLLSGGEKSMTALAFVFAVFLARPCPFYILDEVEAALDDVNLERFLALLRRYADRAQFIVITHQKRTMDAADTLYGVSMGSDGVSKVLSRRLPAERGATAGMVGVAEVA
jgi:chromosome segregation protein